MANLPVREMVLYKHGVGFFVRQGEIEGDSADLTFRKDEINDVLKSLAVFDQAGGQILGIHYDTPMDRAHRLKSSSVNVSKQHALHDLIGDLQGRLVTMKFEPTPGTIEAVDGRVIGVDRTAIEHHMPQIVILDDDGETHVYSMDMLRKFKIKDAQSEHDLSYFLDTSMTEDDRRVVNLRLSEGAHDLVVYYVAPSPTWRVSYRLVAETEEGGSTGKALLQGWGLFDNRLEEDLDNVRVTLVAGQPISFIYDLYSSTIPERKTIVEEDRTTEPVGYEGVELRSPPREDSVPSNEEWSEALPKPKGAGSSKHRSYVPPGMVSSTKVSTEGKAVGETFQYIVTAPVTVKRGESALVPIIETEIQYERELLYNRDKLPDHPVAAISFTNATGLTLERGPITVVEDGDYKGEAILPFTNDNTQMYLPYAVELRVKVREDFSHETGTFTLKVRDINSHYEYSKDELWERRYIRIEYFRIETTVYKIENDTDEDRTITIEHLIDEKHELVHTREPDVTTLNAQRWRVDVPARTTAEFTRKIRRKTGSEHMLDSMDHKSLQHYYRINKMLDEVIYEGLSQVIDLLADREDNKSLINKLHGEREQLYTKQDETRKNLGALQPTGQEAELRNRMLEQLESTQNRLDEIDGEIKSAQTEIERLKKSVDDILETLGKTAE